MIKIFRFAAFAALLAMPTALAGCATTRTTPPPTEVKVPVPVPCKIRHIDEPVIPAAPTNDLAGKVKALIAEIELRVGYEAQLRAAEEACQ